MASSSDSMTTLQKRAAFSVAGIFSTRMLGLFMIFPVFALFAEHAFVGVTPTQIGLAIGIYGLTQALLQIPYGMLSDRFGRKPLIILGMSVFMVGSIVCALADSIEMMILGRALQGMGAVAAVLMATVADLVPEQFRLRAMSIVGMTIGLSFTMSLVLGPLLAEFFGVRGIFWVTAGMAIVGILLVVFAVPPIEKQEFQREAEADPAQFRDVLRNPQLLRLDFGVFVLHAMLTAMFIALPLMIRDQAGLDSLHHWELYLPVMLISFVLMVPFIIQAESKGRMKPIFVGAILTIALAQVAFLMLPPGYGWMFVALLVFFTAFNLLEASLPSLVVKLSPPDKKGTASGVYSTSQFMGAALGGVFGGMAYQAAGTDGLFAMTALMGVLWFGVALTMQKPLPLSIASLPLPDGLEEAQALALQETMLEEEGVHDVVVRLEEHRAYFKIDRKQINEPQLQQALAQRLGGDSLQTAPSSATGLPSNAS